MAKQETRKDTSQLGPGKGGAGDFVAVRINSLALMLLYAWLLTAIVLLPNLSYPVVAGWLRHPLNAVMMILLIGVSFWHVKYGLHELIDDYVHTPLSRALGIAAIHAFTIVGTVFGVWSVARIALVPA